MFMLSLKIYCNIHNPEYCRLTIAHNFPLLYIGGCEVMASIQIVLLCQRESIGTGVVGFEGVLAV